MERPEQVKDLEVVQKGRTFELDFTLPALATDGERLTKPLEIEIFRTVTPRSGAAAAPFPETGEPMASLKPEIVARLTAGGKLVYTQELSPQDYSSTQGAMYAFAVRGLTYGFRHRPLKGQLSNVARAVLVDVSGPVENLRIQSTEKALEVQWDASSKSLSGNPVSELAGYRVYRSDTGKPGSYTLLAETASPNMSDADFVFGHTYFYKVRAVFKSGSTSAESEDSAVAEITPHDVFPPPVPQGVRAIYAEGAVEIVWSPSEAADLAGYNIFRREAAGAETRVNQELIRTPVFRDAQAAAGQRYVYHVTAVDLAGNESAPSNEAEVETR